MTSPNPVNKRSAEGSAGETGRSFDACDSPAGTTPGRLRPILLSYDETAEILSLSKMTVMRMTYGGAWPVVRIGRSIRIDRADVERWVAANKSGAAA